MISVIIPVYNEEKFIKNCLISLAEQTEQAFEIILVDNNCTEQTVAIAENVAQKYGFKLAVVQEGEKGIVPARVRGFEFAKNEYLASTDADVLVDKNWLAEIKEKFSQGFDFLVGDAYFDKSFWVEVPDLGKWFRETQRDLHKINEFFPSMTNGANFALTKKCFDAVKKDILVNRDDRIFGFNASLLGYKLEKIKTVNIASPRRFVYEFFTLASSGTYAIRESDFRDEEDEFRAQCEVVNNAAKKGEFDSEKLIINDIREYLFPAVLTNKTLFKKIKSFFDGIDEIEKYIGDKMFFSDLKKLLEISKELADKHLIEIRARLLKL